MNTNYTLHTLYALSHDRMAEIRREQQAEMRAQARRPAPAGQPRSVWQDPMLYFTVSFAALVVTLLDIAVRVQ